MTLATICIPSNRKLVEAVEPLWSAINYAAAAGMKVVISDNSGDAEKKDYFSTAPSHVTYLPDTPEHGGANLLSALRQAESEFVLVLGDDDFINFVDGGTPFDFSSLPADVVGVKPHIELADGKGGVSATDTFTIDGGDAAARVLEYTRKAGKANTTYYSFFRRSVLMGVNEPFIAHHPLSPGYSDWATVYALAASGRIVHDPRTVLRYDNSRWDDMETAGASLDRFYGDTGLPPETRLYMSLLHFLDIYVLMFRQTSNLPPIEQYKAAYAAAMVFLKRLLFRYDERPFLYVAASDLMEPLRAAVESSDPDLDHFFHLAGLIADRLKPGLKQQYDRYLLAVSRGV
ncbi:hypothetical protein IHQ71_13025 [Rhizobium sp. TH2]|uniref:hypothetical protein n=1 Tax=Rhizobium sp. TH2 TaxID=2775403 RepID=UPI002157B12C|nr:hypothetical protein [Rhizobium sp. TH2]UVC11410.1 hypothetical protein IHQ71_13025 [Rhizobium sp. TH2]